MDYVNEAHRKSNGENHRGKERKKSRERRKWPNGNNTAPNVMQRHFF